MSDWIRFEGMWPDLVAAKLAHAGVQVRYRNAHYSGKLMETSEALIGDVNENGGGCDCCGLFDHRTVISEYRVLLPPVPAPER